MHHPLIDALDVWRKNPDNLCSKVGDHWSGGPCTVAEVTRSQAGNLSPKQTEALGQTLKDLSDPRHCAAMLEALLPRTLLAGDCESRARARNQLVCLTKGLCHGVMAASLLTTWDRKSSLSAGFVDHVQECFRNYHQAWDLWSRPVTEKVSIAGRQACRDRATLALDACLPELLCRQRALVKGQGSLTWLNESTWLSVRRLLSYMLGDADAVTELENEVHMLLVSMDNEEKYRGLTRPGSVKVIAEGYNAFYLDPIKLGTTLLDEQMLDSLRLASRVARTPLGQWSNTRGATAYPLSLRLSLDLGEVHQIEGSSAGGLLAAASFATARQRKINRRATASFVVECVPEAWEKMRTNHDYVPSVTDIVIGPVSPQSIWAKVTSEEFNAWSPLRVFLHHLQTQQQGGGSDAAERSFQTWTREYNHTARITARSKHHPDWTEIQTIETLEEAIEELTKDPASTWGRATRVISPVAILIATGIFVFSYGLYRQELKIDQTRMAINKQAEHLRQVAPLINDAESTRIQLIRRIQRSYADAMAKAEDLPDWKMRDAARRVADQRRERQLSTVDDLLNSMNTTINSNRATGNYLEMSRILREQGAEEAIAYVDSKKATLYARFEHEQESNRRDNLLPILDSIRQQVILGRFDAALAACTELLGRDPNWADSLHEQIRILSVLAEESTHYGKVSRAHSLFSQAVEHADLLSKVRPPYPQSQRIQLLASNRLGDMLSQMGHYSEAHDRFLNNLEISQRLHNENPGDPETQQFLMISNGQMGEALTRLGKPHSAIAYFEKAISGGTKLVERHPERKSFRRELSVTHLKIAQTMVLMGQFESAYKHCHVGLELIQTLNADNTNDSELLQDVSAFYSQLGLICQETGRLDESLSFRQDALKINKQLVLQDPLNVVRRRELFVSHISVGHALEIVSRPQESQMHYLEGLAIAKQLAIIDPTDAYAQHDLCYAHRSLGEFLLKMNQLSDAHSHFKSGLEIAEHLATLNPVDAQPHELQIAMHGHLGDLLFQMGDFSKSLEHYKECLRIREQVTPLAANDANYLFERCEILLQIGSLHLQLGQPMASISDFSEYLAICKQLVEVEPINIEAKRNIVLGNGMLGEAWIDTGEFDRAIPILENAITSASELLAVNNSDIYTLQMNWELHDSLGRLLLETDQQQKAEQVFQNGLEIGKRLVEIPPPDHRLHFAVVLSYQNLARLAAINDRRDQAIQFWTQASHMLDVLIQQGIEVDAAREERDFINTQIESLRNAKAISEMSGK